MIKLCSRLDENTSLGIVASHKVVNLAGSVAYLLIMWLDIERRLQLHFLSIQRHYEGTPSIKQTGVAKIYFFLRLILKEAINYVHGENRSSLASREIYLFTHLLFSK